MAERFSGTSGKVAASIALVLSVAAMIAVLLDGIDPGDLVVLAVVALVGAVVWVVYLRPAVVVTGEDLILRGMLTETQIPLVTLREFEVRQFVVARTDDRAFTCTALGRGRRELIRGGDKLRDPVQHFPAFVEQRVMQRVEDAQAVASSGPNEGSSDARSGRGVSKRVAWLEIVLLAGLVAVTALLIAVI